MDNALRLAERNGDIERLRKERLRAGLTPEVLLRRAIQAAGGEVIETWDITSCEVKASKTGLQFLHIEALTGNEDRLVYLVFGPYKLEFSVKRFLGAVYGENVPNDMVDAVARAAAGVQIKVKSKVVRSKSGLDYMYHRYYAMDDGVYSVEPPPVPEWGD